MNSKALQGVKDIRIVPRRNQDKTKIHTLSAEAMA